MSRIFGGCHEGQQARRLKVSLARGCRDAFVLKMLRRTSSFPNFPASLSFVRGISSVGSKSAAQDRLTVYDIHNKFIAYHSLQAFPPIVDVLCEWGVLYVITGATKEERKVFVLHEKDMQAKLKDLFKKSMFDLAINLAKSQQYDPDGLIDIFT